MLVNIVAVLGGRDALNWPGRAKPSTARILVQHLVVRSLYRVILEQVFGVRP